ncbi:MAG: SpoIVB peptidase S55 domain-containing protein [Longicatena sp.]
MLKKLCCLAICLCCFLPIPIYAQDELYLGGDNIGIEVDYDGVFVSGTYPFSVEGKKYVPLEVQAKDIIKEVDGVAIHSLNELSTKLSSYQEKVNHIPILIERLSQSVNVSLTTVFDSSMNAFKSGLYVKDKIVGVGTLTYFDPSNQTYGALGHEIMDSDVKEIADIHLGHIYPAFVNSIQKAQQNIPGEKQATIFYQQRFANVKKNSNIGIYGQYDRDIRNMISYPWATRQQVQLGEATMYTVINGQEIKPYQIQITKLNKQDTKSIKGIEFSVKDPQLLSLTNGIIQGMSGSPIVQNGKIIGAVTHVVTANPINGYGVYIEFMLEESRNLS